MMIFYIVYVVVLYLYSFSDEYAIAQSKPDSSARNSDFRVDELIADQYVEEGKLDEAITLYRKLLLKNPSSGRIHYRLGYAYGLKNLYDEEIAEYKKAIKMGYKEEEVFYRLGLAYIDSETNYAEAVKAFNKVLQRNPRHAEAYFNLGLSYLNLGNYSKAKEALLKAIELNPSNLEAYNMLGVVYALTGQSDKAQETWMEILKRDPSNRPALLNLETLEKNKLEQKSTTIPQKIIEASKKTPPKEK
ncbi:MAG TPA: tetratricopeptide repeat protein [Candidatus Limnocylindrales bacterium]|nr:tetratricopeptide repeat protein [Candidatus Limnocylindrales bacterium]